MSEAKTHYRTCNICEAMCGLEIKHQGGEILSIKGDNNDPFSRGHICPKAVALQDFYRDKDRLKTPLKRTADGWQEISWNEAFAEIATRFRDVQQAHGKDAVGVYLGNPNAHNFGNAIMLPRFFKALGTNNRYSSASADQLPHHVASNYMLGAGMLIPIPDIDHTDFMLIIGANPIVSNGSLMTAPGVGKRLKAIQQRGGKVVVVDPRRTETAKKADRHLFIRPETDALFMLALVHTLFDEQRVNLGHLESRIHGLDSLAEAVKPYSPETVADACGMEATAIRELAREMATAKSAVCYSRMGASTQSFGGLCQWLNNVLNILTGNFDRRGGAMFPQPVFDLVRDKKGKPSSYGRYESRVRKLPYFNNEFPVATLADEILTPGEGQIRAMITVAGNPVLSAPGGMRLEEAFDALEFMVSVDIYLNETTRHADIILPATTGLEVPHFDVFFNSFAVRNTAKFSEPMFEKSPDQKHDWEILRDLALHLTGREDDGVTPEMMLDAGLKHGAYGAQGMSLDKLKDNPHGLDLGPLQPCLEQRIQTEDGLIRIAPQLYLDDLKRLDESGFSSREQDCDYPFSMISRRLPRSHNTWTQNSHRLVKGKNPCTVQMNTADAQKLGLTDGQNALVVSSTGKIQLPVEFNDDMFEGVISIPQGWGHNRANTAMTVAESQPGVSMNDITDSQRIDALTGNAAFNGTRVAVRVA
ncbi:Anaerobic selenocysteine-containing dehydrogenase [Marinobacter antarcticus]|uniref:Anaerobic selenocysteine-containing dehydrogenase n=1 Tax=Marinobacter antarcticus TaxID=564117 RepID=A0A1M6UBP7_9GAMM|nr:molybdopterin-dependent oxidoreductase [Marinobacter antarcticus]SHK66675.1 Anaerobic selenocysteine-containing dehydrogenase [Marinobacter antarcticus]